MKVNTSKVWDYLRSLNEADFEFTKQCIGMRDAITNLVKRHELSNDDVIDIFSIKESELTDFMNGSFDYSIRDVASLNAAFMKYEMEKLKDKVPVNVDTPYKYSS